MGTFACASSLATSIASTTDGSSLRSFGVGTASPRSTRVTVLVPYSPLVRCESFRNFVMCLHGLDILSTWVLFSPFCVRRLLRFSILTWPRTSTFLSRIVWTIHGHVLQEWTRCVFLEIVCILCADHVFWYPWFIFRRIQQLCLLPSLFLVCTQTYLEVCVVERIVARSVSSPEFFLLSASVCVAPFFSNPCLQGWATTICSFVYMGARDSCLRA